jgi:hypothetical protein
MEASEHFHFSKAMEVLVRSRSSKVKEVLVRCHFSRAMEALERYRSP